MGRAFALRDRGELEEALEVCRRAIQVAGPIDPGKLKPSSFSTIVVGALTIDEIASKLGQPHLACEPLANALLVLESANREGTKQRSDDELLRTERKIRQRLEHLRPTT